MNGGIVFLSSDSRCPPTMRILPSKATIESSPLLNSGCSCFQFFQALSGSWLASISKELSLLRKWEYLPGLFGGPCLEKKTLGVVRRGFNLNENYKVFIFG